MRTELSFPDGWTDVPYWEDGDDPRTKHEFIDLRAQPGRVGELPEVHRAVGLRDALLAINGAGSPFRTFGCDFALDRGDFGEGFTHLAHSYIHLGFADPGRCRDRDAYYLAFGRLAECLHGAEEFEAGDEERFHLEFRIEALRMGGEDVGAVANLSCDVLASSEGRARRDWAKLIGAIAAHLAGG
jgi:hypothetical protein